MLAAEQLVAEHAALVLPQVTDRDTPLPSLPGKADAVVGMRRAGKTWRVLQKLRDLEREGVPRGHTLYVNLEDERLAGAGVELFEALVAAAYRREPTAATAPFWLLLDEVQVVPRWEAFVRRMLDTRRVHVVVTGSSAKLLSREVATSLRGRSLATELLPFSFRESLRHAGITVPEKLPPAPRSRAELERALATYVEAGGFPEIQALPSPLRRRVLQEYVDVTLLRDVVERHRATNTVALRRLVSHLLRSPAGKLSVHKLYNDLRSQGIAVGKDHLHEYLAHLEDACFVFTVPVDSPSERRRAVVPRKVYLVDHALAQLAAVDAPRDDAWAPPGERGVPRAAEAPRARHVPRGRRRERRSTSWRATRMGARSWFRCAPTPPPSRPARASFAAWQTRRRRSRRPGCSSSRRTRRARPRLGGGGCGWYRRGGFSGG